MQVYENKVTVRILDVGENNELTTKGLIQYLQEIAGMHSASLGYGLNDLETTNLSWIILNWKIQMFSHPSWDSKLVIKTWPRIIEKFYSYRDFEVYDEGNNLVAIATSKWVLTNTRTNSIARITPEMISRYNPLDKAVFNEKMEEKPKEPENMKLVYGYTIQRRDIDTNHHVNNLYYLDFAYEALPEDVFNNMSFNNVEIIYKKEIKYKDEISCFYCKKDDMHIVTIKSADLKTLHSIIKFF